MFRLIDQNALSFINRIDCVLRYDLVQITGFLYSKKQYSSSVILLTSTIFFMHELYVSSINIVTTDTKNVRCDISWFWKQREYHQSYIGFWHLSMNCIATMCTSTARLQYFCKYLYNNTLWLMKVLHIDPKQSYYINVRVRVQARGLLYVKFPCSSQWCINHKLSDIL